MGVLKVKVGGSWLDIGPSGADEVMVGATAPVDVTTELWYDTSAVPAFDPAKMPRGSILYGSYGVQHAIGATTVVCGPVMTWTANPTRMYRVAIHMSRVMVPNSDMQIALHDGAGTLYDYIYTGNPGVAGQIVITGFTQVTGKSGSFTLQLMGNAGGSGATCQLGTWPTHYSVDDVGGV